MEHPNSEPSQIHAIPTTSQYTQCTSTKQRAHKFNSAPVASTSTNEHPNTTTKTPTPTLTDSPFRCTQCDKTFKTKNSHYGHLREKHSVSPPAYKCSQCSRVYTRKNALNTHLIEKHLETLPTYKCTQCDKEFHVRAAFHFHRLEQHFSTPNTYVCNECNKQFRSKNGFDYHFKLTHPTTPIVYKLTQCNKLFQRRGELLRHKKEFHEGVNQPDCQQHDSPDMVGKKFKCTKCPKKYPRAKTLRRHVREKHLNDFVGIHIHQQNPVNEIVNESAESILGGIKNSNRENPSQVVPKRKRRKTRAKWSRAKQYRPTQARVEPVTESPENFASTSTMHDPPQASGHELVVVVARRYPCEICGKMLQKGSLNRHRRQVHKSNDMTDNLAVQDYDDSVSEINVQEGIDGQPEIDDQYEIYAQPGIDGRDLHGVDGQNGMDYQDEDSNQSSISIIEVKSESSQLSKIAPFEPVLDQPTRQIVFELKQVDQFVNHLLNKDSSDGFTLETLLKEFEKLSTLITKLGAPGQVHLAEEWMQRKCSLWDEIDYFKKKSLQDDLEHKRKLIMKLIEHKHLVVDAIEDLKGALDKVQHSQEWDSILLDIRSLYDYMLNPSKVNLIQIQNEPKNFFLNHSKPDWANCPTCHQTT